MYVKGAKQRAFKKVEVNFPMLLKKLRKLRTKMCLPDLANRGHQ